MAISRAIRARVVRDAGNRCGYCLANQSLLIDILEVEHITPKYSGGTDDVDNLWLACRSCNVYKGIQVTAYDPQTGRQARLFNPRKQSWNQHFSWSIDGTMIIGLTATGRGTVEALRLNNPVAVRVRAMWVSAGWHPPVETEIGNGN